MSGTPDYRRLLKDAYVTIETLKARVDDLKRARSAPIAVVGIGCRFPGTAGSPEQYWDLLCRGESAIVEVPADRWDIEAYYDPDPDRPGRMYSRHGGFLPCVDQFDPQFFGISPREAQTMDPQQRLLLEVCWEALENGGQNPLALAGSACGVFVGISSSEYGWRLNANADEARDLYMVTGNALSIAAGRVAYCLGLNGPAMAVDTACSSALACVHLAMRSLRNEECRLALAGGVNVMVRPESTMLTCRGHMLAHDGRCKTFDAAADGYVRGEGCGIVVLKRLKDALADGDRVQAVLLGSASNQDGRSSGLTAPNGAAQEALLRAALRDAGIGPERVSYVEAHGTGTSLGDPIEMRALQAVYAAGRNPESPLRVGSVKTNVGHLEPAAGVAGLIKVVLSLEHGAIPRNLNFDTPSPHIQWEAAPVEVPTRTIQWARGEEPRCAGVSAFGFSGTNVHVVVQEAPQVTTDDPAPRPDWCLLTLSARTDRALRAAAANLERHLQGGSPDLRDVCYSANAGRATFEQRLALVADSTEDARGKLRDFVEGRAGGVVSGSVTPGRTPRVAFLFTGQGAQYPGMGRRLFETQPVFRDALEACDEALGPIDGRRLIDVLYRLESESARPILQQTLYAQPALFAIEYALTRVWAALGVEPAAVIGHSVGEFAAACAAGVFDLRDGLALIAARARLMQALPTGGGMLAVSGDEALVRDAVSRVAEAVTIAAVNGPGDLVLSGNLQVLARLETELAAAHLLTRRLDVSHAFHSPLMRPMIDEFEQVARGVTHRSPALRLMSNVTGRPVTDAEPMDAAYWRSHVMAPVQFAPSLAALRDQQYDLFVEIGPHPVLVGLGRKMDAGRTGVWLPSLRRDKDDVLQLRETLGELFVRGLDFDGLALEAPARPHKVALPTYPFERQRFWVSEADVARPTRANGRRSGSHPLLGGRVRSPLCDMQFESIVSARDPEYLAGHVVFGQVVLPATASIEMALAAGRQAFGAGSARVEQVCHYEPLVFTDDQPRILQTLIERQDATTSSFRIFSARSDNGSPDADGTAEWTLHCAGALRGAGERSAEGEALAAVRRRCTQPVDVEDYYRRLAALGLGYSRAFRALESLWRGNDEALGRVRLGPADAGEARDHVAHPALLDGCLQVLGAALEDPAERTSTDLYLPTGFDAVEIWESRQATLWSRARIRAADAASEVRVADLDLFTDDGTPAGRIEGVLLKRVSGGTLHLAAERRRATEWLYAERWDAFPADRGGDASVVASRPWIVFGRRDAITAGLVGRLRQHRCRVEVIVPAATGYTSQPDDSYEIDPDRPDDFDRVLANADAVPALSPPGIVYLWGLGEDDALGDDQGARAAAKCRSLLHLVQAIARSRTRAKAALWIVTSGAQRVGEDGRPVAVAQAPLVGFARSVALEHPDVGCVRIDLDPLRPDQDVEALWCEIGTSGGEDEVAWRDGARRVRRLVRADTGAASPRVPPLSADATYVVTGGLGALGAVVARWLAARGARHLVLVGRRAAGASLPMIDELREAGVTVVAMRADVSDETQIHALFTRIETSMPPVRGIVHAAGLTEDGMVADQPWSAFARVLAPKAAGAWNLHRRTLGCPLDFFVLFSSAASFLGSPGQANYAAANAFLDALAQHRATLGQPALSINWGPWAGGGMATDVSEAHQRRWAGQGVDLIQPDTGVAAMEWLLSRGVPQAAVLPIDWSRPQLASSSWLDRPLYAEVRRFVGPRSAASATELRDRLVAASPAERERAAGPYARAAVGRILGLDPSGLGGHQRLTDLGVDSLMALELRNAIAADLRVTLPIARLLDGPTVDDLARIIGSLLQDAADRTPAEGAGASRETTMEEGEI